MRGYSLQKAKYTIIQLYFKEKEHAELGGGGRQGKGGERWGKGDKDSAAATVETVRGIFDVVKENNCNLKLSIL